MSRYALTHPSIVLLLIASAMLSGILSAKTADATACAVAHLQQGAPGGTTITAVTMVEASGKIPPYCNVDGFVATPGNTVNFRLALPTNWNGKFYFEGVGGFGGSIGSLDRGLERGYASASTDTGHQGTDASWALNNLAKKIDYGYRGTHVTAVATKSLSQAYYGTVPHHAYFNGCSNGGRQALMEAQRYPEDFDGIVAGDPAFGTLQPVRRVLIYEVMMSAPERFLPAAKLDLISKAVLANCDARDGLADGLVTDPRACSFRPETLKCAGADGFACLTGGQIDTLTKIYADQPGPHGQVLPGYPVGHEDGPTGWQLWITGTVDPVLSNNPIDAVRRSVLGVTAGIVSPA